MTDSGPKRTPGLSQERLAMLARREVDIWINKSVRHLSASDVLSACTHLGIAAHPDDLEMMAYSGIEKGRVKACFVGITICDGAGAPRGNAYKKLSPSKYVKLRRSEQIKAAIHGNYLAQFQLGFDSKTVQDFPSSAVLDLMSIIETAKPKTIYIHNLFDKHPTHVVAALQSLDAIRLAVRNSKWKPEKVFGCEIWRGLDWLRDSDKVLLPIKSVQNQKAMVRIFKSQIKGIKNYPEGVVGREISNAVFLESKAADLTSAVTLAMDLTSLALNPRVRVKSFVRTHLNRMVYDTLEMIGRFT